MISLLYVGNKHNERETVCGFDVTMHYIGENFDSL
jgi:hypothetical protein